MINGNITPDAQQVLLGKLSESKFEFHSTGSRQFGNVRTESDYDLFAQHSKRLETFLLKLGFKRFDKETCRYGDSNLHSLYEYLGVQIQLQKNADRKIQLQNWILSSGFQFATDKSLRRKQWNFLYENVPC